MAIYTKKGDKGETGFVDVKKRASKDSLIVEALGTIDELNSFLGIAKTQVKENTKLQKTVGDIQRNLLTIGSITAGSKLRFSENKTKELEKLIDELEGKLPVLKNFVVPGGTLVSSYFQYARSLARRAERRMVALSKVQKTTPPVLQYLNRLSDAIFMLAREANREAGVKDEVWKGRN
jgi:cob(I)alamin adenosyltransferase